MQNCVKRKEINSVVEAVPVGSADHRISFAFSRGDLGTEPEIG